MKPTHPSARGMTLLEVLVAVTCLVTIVTVVYGSVATAGRSLERTRPHLARARRTALAFQRIERLLFQGVRSAEQNARNASLFSCRDGQMLDFVIWESQDPERWPRPARIHLAVTNQALVLETVALGPDLAEPIEAARTDVLLAPVAGLSVRCLGPAGWTERLDHWPRAVELTVQTGSTSDPSFRMVTRCPPGPAAESSR